MQIHEILTIYVCIIISLTFSAISKDDRDAWLAKGIEFVQLPFVLSAVSFFHNIPGVPSGDKGLNMTACLLAQIFDAQITTWDHPDILNINPGLNVEKDYPIYVGRRVLGSSSTYSMTHYLHSQCPQTEENPNGWPESKTASKIEWHPSTNPCDGSGLMSDCIQSNDGSIGYVDAAHGHEAMLTEIRISNKDGRFLTSKDAGDTGIQEAAVDLSDVPDAADGDFSEVAFYNMVCFVGCGIGCSTICWMCGTVCLLYVIMISFSVTLSFTIVAWPKHLAHLPSFLHLHP